MEEQKFMKVALVTGGAKGIGREIAIYLKQQGWHIIIHYNESLDEAKCIAEEIGAELIQADFSKPREVKKVFNRLSKPIDLLINNAAILKKEKFGESFEENFFRTMGVNLFAPIYLSLEFIKKCIGGNIINIVDVALSELSLSFISYIISKQGLEVFTKLAQPGCAQKGIRINAIAIGATLFKDTQSREVFEDIKSKCSSNIHDICQAIDFILSNKTLNGEILNLAEWKSNP